MSDRFVDRLSLRGMRFEGRHGVHAWEHETSQPFEVDVVLHADLSAAAEADDLATTVDYGAVFALVERIVTGPHHDLIEALAGTVARAVLDATDPRVVDGVEVRVRKPEAPIDGELDAVEAALVRRRPDAAGGA